MPASHVVYIFSMPVSCDVDVETFSVCRVQMFSSCVVLIGKMYSRCQCQMFSSHVVLIEKIYSPCQPHVVYIFSMPVSCDVDVETFSVCRVQMFSSCFFLIGKMYPRSQCFPFTSLFGF